MPFGIPFDLELNIQNEDITKKNKDNPNMILKKKVCGLDSVEAS